MERFGLDKPDLRFGFELVNISDEVAESEFKVFSSTIKNGGAVKGINVKGYGDEFTRKGISSLEDYVKTYGAKGLAWIKLTDDGITSPIAKFLGEEELEAIIRKMEGETGDLLLFVADKLNVVYDSLGNLRNELARRLNLLDDNEYNLVWITEFPLFEYDEEEGDMANTTLHLHGGGYPPFGDQSELVRAKAR